MGPKGDLYQTWIELRTWFFGFMGVSGWMMLVLIVLENRVAMPIAGGNSALDWLMVLTIIFWLLTKYETRMMDWWRTSH